MLSNYCAYGRNLSDTRLIKSSMPSHDRAWRHVIYDMHVRRQASVVKSHQIACGALWVDTSTWSVPARVPWHCQSGTRSSWQTLRLLVHCMKRPNSCTAVVQVQVHADFGKGDCTLLQLHSKYRWYFLLKLTNAKEISLYLSKKSKQIIFKSLLLQIYR